MGDFVWSSWTQDGQCDHAFIAPSVDQFCDSDHGGGGGGAGGGIGDNGGGFWEEGKAGSASKNHSEAEKRRRDRINAHLATLRKLVSNSEKMDKATLLGKVVEHIKDLKTKTMELGEAFTVPTDLDEVIIDLESNTEGPCNHVIIKASVCCEDRPELFSEIKQAIDSLRLTMIEANMTCLGGRIICNFILCVTNSTSENEISTLKQSLKVFLGRIVSSSSWTSSSNYRIKSKRQRFFSSSNYGTNDR